MLFGRRKIQVAQWFTVFNATGVLMAGCLVVWQPVLAKTLFLAHLHTSYNLLLAPCWLKFPGSILAGFACGQPKASSLLPHQQSFLRLSNNWLMIHSLRTVEAAHKCMCFLSSYHNMNITNISALLWNDILCRISLNAVAPLQTPAQGPVAAHSKTPPSGLWTSLATYLIFLNLMIVH